MSDKANGETDDIGEYLGTDRPVPAWKRTMKYWLPLLVLIALGIAAYFKMNEGGKKTNYITQTVEERALDLTVTATGSLRPTNLIEVGSETSGRIDDVRVDVNDIVTRGQILAIINTDVINDQITQNRAQLDAQRASVAQARATLDVDKAQLNRLREVFKLSEGKVPSQTEMDTAKANVLRDEASVASALANVRSAEASLSSARTNQDRAIIRSPVAGVVLARQVETGQTVAASFNTPTLFVLAEDLSAMQLRVDIDEADVGQVASNQTASFTVDAYPGQKFPATVTRVDLASGNIANTEAAQSNSVVSYEARLSVANIDGLLRPGMTATATIATQSTGVQMLVPNAALRFQPDDDNDSGGGALGGGPGGNDFGLEQEAPTASIGVGSHQIVHVLLADGTLDSIDVVTGQSDGRWTVITSDDLTVGMDVVTGEKAAGE